ncbi:MAPEG family protein [Agarivorans sp. MS3-6]
MSMILLCLALLLVLPYLLAAAGSLMKRRQLGVVNNHDPREQALQLNQTGRRLYAAQQNAWEALSLFTAVTAISYFSGLKPEMVHIPALVFLATRIAHPLLYVFGLATLRSLVTALGWLSCIYIVCLAFIS